MKSLVALLLLTLPSSSLHAQPELLIAPFDAETAQQAQRDWAEHLDVEVTSENSIGMQMILIPPGEFLMGGDQTPEEIAEIMDRPTWVDVAANEQPQHYVQITRPIYIGTYEVTQQEWESVIGSNPSEYASTDDRDRSRFPVENVS